MVQEGVEGGLTAMAVDGGNLAIQNTNVLSVLWPNEPGPRHASQCEMRNERRFGREGWRGALTGHGTLYVER